MSKSVQRDGGLFFFFQAEDGIRDLTVTGVQTCALPICGWRCSPPVTATATSPRSPRTWSRCSRTTASRSRCSRDRKSTRLNSSHSQISYAVFCLKKKKNEKSVIQSRFHRSLIASFYQHL